MKVLLIDDHPLILSALKLVVQGMGDDFEVKGVAGAAQARLALEEGGDHDLVLLDLQLGDISGFDLLGELRASYPALPVVVVSASFRTSDVIRAIDMGAMGFVYKHTGNEVLVEALKLVMSGGIYVPPITLEMGSPAGLERFTSTDDPDSVMRLGNGADGARPLGDGVVVPQGRNPLTSVAALGLTPRQNEVLALLLQGKPNKMIARDLNLSVETIKDHVAAVLRSLGVSSRTQAVLAVSQLNQQGGELGRWRPRD
jgi:DNA-binding NarL/FixJ family response regulator